jgi:hypothetical protein
MNQNQDEHAGQWEFFHKVSLDKIVIVDSNTDGYIPGTLFEFKRFVGSIDAVLFQAIKYLSQMRLKGRPVHKNIIRHISNR